MKDQQEMSYENISIQPFNIELINLQIESGINEHAELFFTGIVSEEEKDRYVENNLISTNVEVKCKDEKGEVVLFKGLVKNIQTAMVRGVYHIEVEAVSHTHVLDIKVKHRSFQNKDMQYGDLVKKILADHSGADFIDTCTKGKKLEKFILQYNETDWEFLKRLASHFNMWLVPDHTSDKPKFWFGTPQGKDCGKLEEYNYSVEKRIAEYRNCSENYINDVEETDFICYDIESKNHLNIGDSVSFNNKKIFVSQTSSGMDKGIFKNDYILMSQKGLSQKPMLNHKVKGLALEGEVIDIKEDNVRVHFRIDKEQNKGEAWWFHYSTFYTTEGQTGWYCMPELGDVVKVYFPTSKEEDGIAINSMRRRTKGGDKVTEPDVKFFRTSFGKELMFREEEVVVTGKDDKVLIKLNEKDGVVIYSNKDVKVVAEGNLLMSSYKNIIVSAGSQVSLKCKASSVKMNGGISLKASKVKRTSTGEVAELPMMVSGSDDE